MEFTILGIRGYLRVIVTQIGYLMPMRSRPQVVMCLHMEAELTALDTDTVEAEWLRQLLMDLRVIEKPIPSILMNCDNQTVIIKVNSSKDNIKSSRDMKRRLKSVRKMRNSRVIVLDYIQTSKIYQVLSKRLYHTM